MCTHAYSAFTQDGYEANFEIFSKVDVNGRQLSVVHDPGLAVKPTDNNLNAAVIAKKYINECEVHSACAMFSARLEHAPSFSAPPRQMSESSHRLVGYQR